MRNSFLLFVLISCSFILTGQTEKKTSFDIFLQSRLLQQPNSFSAGQEFSLGGRYNFKIIKPISIHVGTLLNYAQYTDHNDDAQETFFVDYYKGTRRDYFNYKSVKQLNLETPIGLHVDLGTLRNSNFAWVGTLSPSINLWS